MVDQAQVSVNRTKHEVLCEYIGTAAQLCAAGLEPQMLSVKSYRELSGWDSYGNRFHTRARSDGSFKVVRWIHDGDRNPWLHQRRWRARWAAAEDAIAAILQRFTRPAAT